MTDRSGATDELTALRVRSPRATPVPAAACHRTAQFVLTRINRSDHSTASVDSWSSAKLVPLYACDSCTCPLDHSTTVSTARGYPLRTPACGPMWAHRVPPALQHVRTRRVCRSAAPTESVRRCRLKSRRCAQYCTSRRIRQARLRFASLQRCKSRFPRDPAC